MSLILCLICISLCVYAFDKSIKKRAAVLYGASIALSFGSLLLPNRFEPAFMQDFINSAVKGGALAGALFILVMYAAVIPAKSPFRAKLMKLRAELAIMASFITLSHNIVYGRKYFVLLFTEAGSMHAAELAAAVLSLLMILLLVPLTLTSFMFVRRKMQPKKWKSLQRWSYLFYAFLYVHIALIYGKNILLGKGTYLFGFILYTLIFCLYLILRCTKQLQGKPRAIWAVSIAGGLAMVCICTPLILLAYAKTPANSPQTESSVSAQSSTESMPAGSTSEKGFTDGTFEGKAAGYNGNVYVSVRVEGGKITDIQITKHSEDEEYYMDAKTQVIADILEKQSTDVDTVSGATSTSDAIILAVKRALGEK